MTFDPQVVSEFERDGFVVLPQVIPQELVSALVEAGDRASESGSPVKRQIGDDGRFRSYRNCVALDPVFVRLLALPEVLPYLVHLLGPDIKLLTSHLIYRDRAPAGTLPSTRYPIWHRDFAKAMRSLGNRDIPRLDIKAAYCLNDLPSTGCGGTAFAPGSHTLRVPLERGANGDPAHVVEPMLKAGDCVLFENRTWHAGSPNLGDTIRKAVMFGYTYVWVEPTDYKVHSETTLHEAKRLYGDIGLQLLGGLEEPVGFDYDFDSQPLRDWLAEQEAPA